MNNDNWDTMNNWNFVLPPSRPSLLELQRITKYIQNLPKEIPVGVLGSTPEYRDLLYELGFSNIYIFDKNGSFYNLMGTIRAHTNNEYFVEGDWFNTLPKYQNIFQFLLSDLTIGNIEYSQRELFYLHVYDSLLPHGLFFDKVLTHPIRNLTIKDLNKKYKQLPLNLETINYFSCEYLFCSQLLEFKNIVDTNLFYDELAQEFKKEVKLYKFSLLAEKFITPRNCTWYYGENWTNVETTYCKMFKSRFIYPDVENSPYYKRLNHFINKK